MVELELLPSNLGRALPLELKDSGSQGRLCRLPLVAGNLAKGLFLQPLPLVDCLWVQTILLSQGLQEHSFRHLRPRASSAD